MKVFRSLDQISPDLGRTIVSIGNFDCVHRAHRKVLAEIVQCAHATGTKSVTVTFEPHPARVLRPENKFKLLTPLQEKLRLLEATGVDSILVLPFTSDLSLMSAHKFADEILHKKLRALEVHEGYNFHFGHKATGNIATLRSFGAEMGFTVFDYSEMCLRGEPVSSSHIRKLVSEGGVSRARHLLSRPFSILSCPSSGRGYGSKYTVPTINLAPYDELVPKNGVYITRTRILGGANDGDCFDSITNVGNRPTFGADSFAIESHLLNFHPLELKAETGVEVHFLSRLRDEIKFTSVDALKEQIGKDVSKARRYFDLLTKFSDSSE